jgi:hypothetical protein
MNELSKIDANTINQVSNSIDTMNNVMNKFNVPSKMIQGLDDFVDAIQHLGKIDDNIAKNLSGFISKTKDSFG